MTNIIALMNIYNEAETIQRSIDSIKGLVDKIIVCDGRYPDFPGPSPVSDDGTLDIIKKYKDIDIKVIVCNTPTPQYLKRSLLLDYLEDGDWAFIMDGDEELVYDEGCNTEFVREEILRHEEVLGYYVKEIVDVSLSSDWWPVIFRYEEGYSYNEDVLLVDDCKKPVLRRPPGTRAVKDKGFYQFQNNMFPLYGCFLHHHKFGRPGQRLANKFEYWKSQLIKRKLKGV